jgi:peptide/nickel transport system substrate-binding protein
VDKYLLGEGWAIVNGFVPRMDNYPFEQVKGHKTNIDQAKELLASAGYPNGKNFPVMDFYVNALEGSSAYKMSMAVVEQIKRGLNIDLKIKLCTLEERDQSIASGKAKIWRSGWVADYPDAENFLSLFYSGNINEGGVGINAFKFRNQQYDALYEQALKETNPDKRNALLVRCDQLTVDYAPVIPILTKDFLVIVNARVRDLKTNSMESLDFSTIYIKEPKKSCLTFKALSACIKSTCSYRWIFFIQPE